MKEYAFNVKETKAAGRGTFAAEDIPKGAEWVVQCVLLSPRDLPDNSILHTYVFGGRHKYSLLAGGFGMFVNCDRKNPNLKCKATDDNKLVFTATRDIAKGEELTLDYGYDVYEFAKLHNIDVNSVNRLVTNQDGRYGR